MAVAGGPGSGRVRLEPQRLLTAAVVVVWDFGIGFAPLFVATWLAGVAGSSAPWWAGWVTVCAPLVLGGLIAGLLATATGNVAPGILATLAGSVVAIGVWTSGRDASCPTCDAWVAGTALAAIAIGYVAGFAIAARFRTLRSGSTDRRGTDTPARRCGSCGTEMPAESTGWRCPGCGAVLPAS